MKFRLKLKRMTSGKWTVFSCVCRSALRYCRASSSDDDHFWTIAGADLKIYYPSGRMVTLETEAMRQSDGTLKPVLLTKVPGIEDLSTCWSSRGFTLEATEILERCLTWNCNAALGIWSQLR